MPQEKVEAPMTGRIISISCKVGDMVKEDDELCILESMKMENPVVSPRAGKIVVLDIALNQAVNVGKVIIVVEY